MDHRTVVRILAFLYAGLGTTLLSAQVDPLEADRPDQTETPSIVPMGWFQLEGGWAREDASLEGSGVRVVSLPAILAKLGLCRIAELRIVMERAEERLLENDALPASGLLPLEVGTKVALCDEKGFRPHTSLLAHLGLPWLADYVFRPDEPYGTFRFSMQHGLSDVFSLGYNLGAEWDGDTPTATGVYTLTVGAAAGDRLGIFVEVYGSISDAQVADHRLDAGATFRIVPDVLLDMSGGRSLGEERWFIGAGLSFRLPVFVPRDVSTE